MGRCAVNQGQPVLMFREPAGQAAAVNVNGQLYLLQSENSLEANVLTHTPGLQQAKDFQQIQQLHRPDYLETELNPIFNKVLQFPSSLQHFRGYVRPIIAVTAEQGDYLQGNSYKRQINYNTTLQLESALNYPLSYKALIQITTYTYKGAKNRPVAGQEPEEDYLIQDIWVERTLNLPAGATLVQDKYRHTFDNVTHTQRPALLTVITTAETNYKGFKDRWYTIAGGL